MSLAGIIASYYYGDILAVIAAVALLYDACTHLILYLLGKCFNTFFIGICYDLCLGIVIIIRICYLDYLYYLPSALKCSSSSSDVLPAIPAAPAPFNTATSTIPLTWTGSVSAAVPGL